MKSADPKGSAFFHGDVNRFLNYELLQGFSQIYLIKNDDCD
jgi:hypothetical protein